MGGKAVGLVSRVLCNARKITQDTYREREGGACPGVSGFAPWAPSRVDMYALTSSVLLLLLLYLMEHIQKYDTFV